MEFAPNTVQKAVYFAREPERVLFAAVVEEKAGLFPPN
jgi:hypothetical protein